jgi:hypothetical protein
MRDQLLRAVRPSPEKLVRLSLVLHNACIIAIWRALLASPCFSSNLLSQKDLSRGATGLERPQDRRNLAVE